MGGMNCGLAAGVRERSTFRPGVGSGKALGSRHQLPAEVSNRTIPN